MCNFFLHFYKLIFSQNSLTNYHLGILSCTRKDSSIPNFPSILHYNLLYLIHLTTSSTFNMLSYFVWFYLAHCWHTTISTLPLHSTTLRERGDIMWLHFICYAIVLASTINFKQVDSLVTIYLLFSAHRINLVVSSVLLDLYWTYIVSKVRVLFPSYVDLIIFVQFFCYSYSLFTNPVETLDFSHIKSTDPVSGKQVRGIKLPFLIVVTLMKIASMVDLLRQKSCIFLTEKKGKWIGVNT